MSEYYSDNDGVASTSEQSCCLESQLLISPPIQSISRSLCPAERLLCIRSKPVYLILMLTAVVGSVDLLIMGAAIGALLGLTPLNLIDASLPFVSTYAFIGFVLIFYPVNGFLADVY